MRCERSMLFMPSFTKCFRLSIILSSFIFGAISQKHALSSLKYKFKGLIGLPKFLKLHVMVEFQDLSANGICLLDFLPIDAANPEVMAKIIRGISVPGEIRTLKSYLPVDESNAYSDNNLTGEGDALVESITSTFDPMLNLYFNNCYHFAYHCYLKEKEYRENFSNL
jgi:hypothetical protein